LRRCENLKKAVSSVSSAGPDGQMEPVKCRLRPCGASTCGQRYRKRPKRERGFDAGASKRHLAENLGKDPSPREQPALCIANPEADGQGLSEGSKPGSRGPSVRPVDSFAGAAAGKTTSGFISRRNA